LEPRWQAHADSRIPKQPKANKARHYGLKTYSPCLIIAARLRLPPALFLAMSPGKVTFFDRTRQTTAEVDK
jgi:hypothetical protein